MQFSDVGALGRRRYVSVTHDSCACHLSPDTGTSSVVNQIPTRTSKAVGIKYADAIQVCCIFYRHIMDKRNHLQLVVSFQGNPFFYCLDPIWVHLLVGQMPISGSKEVGREHMNDIHFRPMVYRFIMDKMTHFYLVLLFKEIPFFYCLDHILVHLLAVLDGYE
jgi:hypothetical protein